MRSFAPYANGGRSPMESLVGRERIVHFRLPRFPVSIDWPAGDSRRRGPRKGGPPEGAVDRLMIRAVGGGGLWWGGFWGGGGGGGWLEDIGCR